MPGRGRLEFARVGVQFSFELQICWIELTHCQPGAAANNRCVANARLMRTLQAQPVANLYAIPVGPKKVHRYSLEFKIQAVRLANHPEIQTQDVARVGAPSSICRERRLPPSSSEWPARGLLAQSGKRANLTRVRLGLV